MSSSLKISANTSEVKKSLLDLGRDVKNLGKTKVSIFSADDRKFIKGELKQELSLMKAKLGENRIEIAKLVREQTKLEKGTKNELEQRKKILAAYQQQTKLAAQMDKIQKHQKDVGKFGGGAGGGGGVMGMLGKFAGMAGAGALAIGGLALVRGYQASNQYAQGSSNRVRLRGLGVNSTGAGAEDLANAGMTEQDMIKRQIASVSRLGRAGGSEQSIMQQAKFERAYGLEDGAMSNVSGSLRATMGGKGADTTQAKLQASIMASGIEDAIGPYLESVTGLLEDINKNGITNTDELTRTFAELAKDGKRTPEQIAEAFGGIDRAVKGASGEANAFLQTAFARSGIGGGTVGATRLAMSSGGIFGLNEDELANKGYNPDLIKNMKGAGFMSGMGGRTGGILNQFKKSAGIGGQNIGDVKDVNTMTGLSTMANGVLGTEGMQGFDALQMMEKVQNKQMSQKQFDDKMKEMREKKDPATERLSKINDTLEGQTEILRNINTNLMEGLGKTTAKAGNIAVEGDNALVQGTGNVAGAIDSTGILDAGMSGAKSARGGMTGGGIGSGLYNLFHGSPEEENARIFREAEGRVSKRGNMPSSGGGSAAAPDLADSIAKGMTKAMEGQKAATIQNSNKVQVRIQNGDGTVTNKTHR